MHDLFQRLKRRHEFWLASVIAVLVVYLSIATQGFLTLQNLFDLLTSYAFLGILAAGLLVVLISGGIDISFTATASIAQYITMLLANKYGLNWFLVFALAIGVGVLLGAINAILIDRLQISSIIVSIATLNIFMVFSFSLLVANISIRCPNGLQTAFTGLNMSMRMKSHMASIYRSWPCS